MAFFQQLMARPKNRKLAIAIALGSTLLPVPIAGIHKFYLGQPLWGAIYFLLWYTPIPRIACAIDAVWYLVQGDSEFERQFNAHLAGANTSPATSVESIAQALRELEQLRTEGLVSEYEFEQKRRQLVDRLA